MVFKINGLCSVVLLSLGLLTFACKGQPTTEDIAADSPSMHQNTLGQPTSDMEGGIMTVFQDRQNNYWFGGSEYGLYRYDGKSLTRYTLEDGLCSHDVLGIQEDKNGNIYFDTPEGVSKFDGQKFRTLPVLLNRGAEHEWQLEPDDLWFRMGWNSAGPYRYDGESLYPLVFPYPPLADTFFAKYPDAPYNPFGIYSIYQDSKGHMWFGTASLGVCRYDGESISWLYEEQMTKIPGGGDFGIRSIIEERGGDFWFCNTRYQYDILPGKRDSLGTNFINYRKEAGVAYLDENEQEDFPYYMSIVEDNEGHLWMATYDEGVWRNDGETLTNYPIKEDGQEVLLFSIYKDRKGGIWVGTHNAGVYRFNGSTFERFRSE